MIDIGCLHKFMLPGAGKNEIDRIMEKGRCLGNRISAVFTLIGHRAFQFDTEQGKSYQALVHNEADDQTDYLVVQLVGEEHGTCFEAVKVEGEWITNYVDWDHFDAVMQEVTAVLLEHANKTYVDFCERNLHKTPEPLTEQDLNLAGFAVELSNKDISMSHAGNRRLAF